MSFLYAVAAALLFRSCALGQQSTCPASRVTTTVTATSTFTVDPASVSSLSSASSASSASSVLSSGSLLSSVGPVSSSETLISSSETLVISSSSSVISSSSSVISSSSSVVSSSSSASASASSCPSLDNCVLGQITDQTAQAVVDELNDLGSAIQALVLDLAGATDPITSATALTTVLAGLPNILTTLQTDLAQLGGVEPLNIPCDEFAVAIALEQVVSALDNLLDAISTVAQQTIGGQALGAALATILQQIEPVVENLIGIVIGLLPDIQCQPDFQAPDISTLLDSVLGILNGLLPLLPPLA